MNAENGIILKVIKAMQTSTYKNQKVSMEDAVSLLGVSSATLRNWIKHDYLTPEKQSGKKLTFDAVQIQNLKERISSGEIDRLSKRANKKHSTNTFIPDEYAADSSVANFVEKILITQREQLLSRDSLLLAIILNLLKSKDLASYSVPLNFEELRFKNKIIKGEVLWWLQQVSQDYINKNYLELLYIELPRVDDLLGLIYQSLSAEGSKAQAGSYYTPKSVVDGIVDQYVKNDSVLLDPCCGTGQFLLSSAGKINNPENLWGFDIDEMAVRLARLNLLLKFSDTNFSPNIYHKNTLLDVETGGLFANTIPSFDMVMTNPPWGVHFSSTETEQLQEKYPTIKSNEAFSYFLLHSLGFLKEGGVLSFILPESILNIKTHRDIREIMLKTGKIQKIKFLDRVFKNVFTPVIQLDIKKEKPSDEHTFQAEKNDNQYPVTQTRLKNNPDYVFDVFSDDQDIAIINKMYLFDHVTLAGNAEWALGVVTGDNKKHLSDTRADGKEPILTGKDVKRFVSNRPKNFIRFEVERFQQVAPEQKYRVPEKLIYKFISKELVFSYDDKQTLTLNSANILIPKITGYPIKSILALLNSSLYQFLHQKKFASLKVLRSDIEKLPLPKLNQKQHQKITSFVENLLDEETSTENRKQQYVELDEYIMDLFDLKDGEKKQVMSNVKISDRLLSIE